MTKASAERRLRCAKDKKSQEDTVCFWREYCAGNFESVINIVMG